MPSTLENALKNKTVAEMAERVSQARNSFSNVIQGPQAYATSNKVSGPGRVSPENPEDFPDKQKMRPGAAGLNGSQVEITA